jgi:hypothetical protein
MGGNHVSSADSKEQTLMIMRMIVNIIFNPAGTPIKSNADERDIHASEKMAAKPAEEVWRP